MVFQDPINPEEFGGDFEGDIVLTDAEKRSRSGTTNRLYRWPNGRIPYVIQTAGYSA